MVPGRDPYCSETLCLVRLFQLQLCPCLLSTTAKGLIIVSAACKYMQGPSATTPPSREARHQNDKNT